MAQATPATRALTAAKVAFRVVEYDYDPGAARIGMQAAEAIGADPSRVFKTLMVEVDGRAACVAIPADRTLSMKKVAAAFGGKSAAMMPPDKAERLTGFHTGGISPFGQKRATRTIFDAAAGAGAEIVLNGGKRGLMVVLAPEDALRVAGATAAELVAD